jgi:hypothetical protein
METLPEVLMEHHMTLLPLPQVCMMTRTILGNHFQTSSSFSPTISSRMWSVVVSKHKRCAVATDQSTEEQLIAQDILHRAKSVLPGNATESFGKKLSVQMSHQRAMLNFKFQDIVREDINEVTVR